MRTILILGGSSEAYSLAEALAGQPGVRVITSLAGRTRERRLPAGDLRVGGFGGIDGLTSYLRRESVSALVDATHPFADTMTSHAAAAAERAGVPIVHVVRPPWRPAPGDRWIEVDTMTQAARAVPEAASPTLLTVGRTELAAFSIRPEIRFIARMIDPPEDDPGIAGLEIVFARGPFRLEEEMSLLHRFGIKCLVSKNAGGEGARAKLEAARVSGLPVVMVRRPHPPVGDTAFGVDGALSWLERFESS